MSAHRSTPPVAWWTRASRSTCISVASIVPLAVLSGAWTIDLAGGRANPVPVGPVGALDAVEVPYAPLDVPVSVTPATGPNPSSTVVGSLPGVVATASNNGVPSVALAAYQRAETVINAADGGCHLPWQLLAAIGRVESNHGQFGGNVLTSDGVATPGIYGVALDGRGATALIRDTDAGQLDNDTVFDRAVGPMQFIPSTWSVVGVDADGDGVRNPQDLDDAALAASVYLCSGTDDLATEGGRRSVIYRYNHSASYVELVLELMHAYAGGDYTTVPDGTVAGRYLTPVPVAGGHGTGSAPRDDDESAPAPVQPSPAGNPESQPEPEEPGKDADNGDSTPEPHVNASAVPPTGIEMVDDSAALAQAVLQCALDGLVDNPLTAADELASCVDERVSGV